MIDKNTPDFDFDLNMDFEVDMDFDLDIDLEVDLDLDLDKTKHPDRYKKAVRIFLEKNDIRKSNFKKKTFLILYKVLNDLILPKKNEQLRIRTQQQINLLSIILKIIDEFKVIEEITILTYTLNRETLETILDLFKSKKIIKINLVLASAYSFRDPKYYNEIKEKFLSLKDKNLRLIFCWSHLKITLIRCAGNYFQFEGSMNYSTNNMVEQLVFENSKETYEYDYNFIENVILKNKNKALEHIC